MVVNYIANGMGAQSMYLLYLAAQRIVPATVSITADTGAEEDCRLSTGESVPARQFFEDYLRPYAERHGIRAVFQRAKRKDGHPMPSLWEHTEQMANGGKYTGIKIPIFGSQGGRLGQSCTSRWKVTAMRQACREMGATEIRAAIGFHYGEVHRIKADYVCDDGGFSVYRPFAIKQAVKRPVKWETHYYPLIDLKMNRKAINDELHRLGIIYVAGSQCDFCPHQDLRRWEQRSPERIKEIADLEAKFNGSWFFTRSGRPLLESIERMREGEELRGRQGNLFEMPENAQETSCANSVCFI